MIARNEILPDRKPSWLLAAGLCLVFVSSPSAQASICEQLTQATQIQKNLQRQRERQAASVKAKREQLEKTGLSTFGPEERELAEAQSGLDQTEVRLSEALSLAQDLRRQLDERAEEISRMVDEARPIPKRAAAHAQIGEHQKCAQELSIYRAQLNEALGRYSGERACLSRSHPSIPSQVSGIVRGMNQVVCDSALKPAGGAGEFPSGDQPGPKSRQPTTPAPPSPRAPLGQNNHPLKPTPTSRSECTGPPPGGNQTRVPPVVGMLSRQAIMQVGLAGLKPFAFEYKRANDPSQNGKVSGTNPGPCAVVDLGTTVDIAYSGDYSARDGPLTSSPQPNPEADPAAEGK